MYFVATNSILGTDLQTILAHSRQVFSRKLTSYRTKRGFQFCSYKRFIGLVHCVFCRREQHTWHRFAVDFEAILRETARKVYSILDRAAPVWSPNRGRRFHAKEPERRGKAVVMNNIFASISLLMKKSLLESSKLFIC